MRIRISPKSNTDINGIISYFFFHKSRINDYVDVFASSTYTFSNFSGPFVTINPLLKGENGNGDNWCSLFFIFDIYNASDQF